MDGIRNGGNSLISKEEGKVSGRAGHVPVSHLWMDDEGNVLTIPYILSPFYPLSDASKQEFEGQVKYWSERTCLKFKEEDARKLTDKVDDEFMVWCIYDKVNRKEDMKLLVESTGGGGGFYGIPPNGSRCIDFRYLDSVGDDYLLLNRMMFSWVPGLMEPFTRADIDQFIGLNFEHFNDIKDRRYMDSLLKCKGKAIPSPVPFDYLSVLMMNSNWYGTPETTPVLVTLDPSQQYLLDFRYRGQLPASFFDILIINTLYKCIPKWEESCKASGKEVPKCKNYGFVTKDCTCLCSPSYSGKTCEKRTGDHFPYPLQDGAFTFAMIDDRSYDLGKLLSIKTASSVQGAHDDLKYNVFINVKIRPKDPYRLPTIKVFVPFKKVGKLLEGKVDYFMQKIGDMDCNKGMRLLWGNSKLDGRRLACECTSTLASNEPVENSRVIRGREADMTVTLVNQLGLEFKSQELTVESSKLILMTEFLPTPKSMMKNSTMAKNSSNGTAGSTGGGDSGGAVTVVTGVNSATAAAMTDAGSSSTLVAAGVAGAGLSLLLVLCLLLFFLKRRKKNKEELAEDEEGDNSGSASESDDEN